MSRTDCGPDSTAGTVQITRTHGGARRRHDARAVLFVMVVLTHIRSGHDYPACPGDSLQEQ